MSVQEEHDFSLLSVFLRQGYQRHVRRRHSEETTHEGFAVILVGDLDQEPAVGIAFLPDSQRTVFWCVYHLRFCLGGQSL